MEFAMRNNCEKNQTQENCTLHKSDRLRCEDCKSLYEVAELLKGTCLKCWKEREENGLSDSQKLQRLNYSYSAETCDPVDGTESSGTCFRKMRSEKNCY